MNKLKLAVLMTCHNRRETTLRCLETLYNQQLPVGVSYNVFLVDDGCTDGTGAAVKKAHPEVHVIQGSGDLFWCNGMRLAWEHAAKEDPDFYLWLNDDVQLHDNAVEKLLSCWLSVVEGAPDGRKVVGCPLSVVEESQATHQHINPTTDDFSKAVIIVGSTCDPETGERTYGGQRRLGKHPASLVPVFPKDVPSGCDTFQGNVVLVSRAVYQKVGNMHAFNHAIGDIDYGLRAKSAGCALFVAPGFLGACNQNRKEQISRHLSLRERWRLVSKRLPPGDWFKFLWAHAGWRTIIYWPKPYIRIFVLGTGHQK